MKYVLRLIAWIKGKLSAEQPCEILHPTATTPDGTLPWVKGKTKDGELWTWSDEDWMLIANLEPERKSGDGVGWEWVASIIDLGYVGSGFVDNRAQAMGAAEQFYREAITAMVARKELPAIKMPGIITTKEATRRALEVFRSGLEGAALEWKIIEAFRSGQVLRGPSIQGDDRRMGTEESV